MGLSTISRDRGRYRFEKGKDKGGASSSSRGPNPRDICNYCKETGHWKIDCPKLKEKGVSITVEIVIKVIRTPKGRLAIGADPDVESSSATLIETEEGFQPVFFKPRRLKNLFRIDQVKSLMPILDMKVANLFEEETTHIFTLCGCGPRSSLRILRPGLAISEMAVS
ncbi:spliceosome-associated protein 130 A [Tanacetum coccineum]